MTKSYLLQVRLKTANDLYHFVTNDLRELPSAEVTTFLDSFNRHVYALVSSTDMNERKGGILTIGKNNDISIKNEVVCNLDFWLKENLYQSL